MSKRTKKKLLSFIIVLILAAAGYLGGEVKNPDIVQPRSNISQNTNTESIEETNRDLSTNATTSFDLSSIPDFNGSDPYCVVNNNQPYFTDDEYTTDVFENYSELDSLGRCGVAYANVCQKLMPTKKRGNIGMVKPTGWHTVKYDCVDGKYLYNRCHLIGFQLAGENANEKNLVTGTRYLNVDGMLPFEDMVADYVKETNHHVLYRVTPIFEGDNLLASGVLMEAASVEDDEIRFNVYVYNAQPDVNIDYATGNSWQYIDYATGDNSWQ